MKPFVVALSIAAPFALLLSACGDEVTEVTEVQQTPVATASSEKDLPDCGKENNGSFVITEDKKDVYVCYAKNWYVLNGKNGSNGNDGTSCTGVAFHSGDSTGFKIVCGKDTLGVILNGTDGVDGADGKNGRNGLVPGFASKLVKRMKRGINTTAFSSPGTKVFKKFDDEEFVSDWALQTETDNVDKLEKRHFKMVADKGFDHIRFQVRWDTHFVGDSSKCQIDSEYMKQIKWAVENTIQNGMIAVVDEHMMLLLQESGQDNAKSNGLSYSQISPCEKAIYKQMATALSEYSTDSVIIELPNEPTRDKYITETQWNNLVDSLIQIVHGIDPARVIIVGGRYNYSKDYLEELQLDDPNGLLMASFHYYEPFEFTNGGSGDECGSAKKPDLKKCGNVKWEGSASQRKKIYNDFKVVSDWSKGNGNMPIYLGEYGTRYFVKDSTSVEKWVAAITQIADQFGFATAMHNLGGDYYVYHIKNNKWVDSKLRGLFNTQYKMSINPDDYDLTKMTSIPIEDFESEGFPSNDYSGNDWWLYAEHTTASNSSEQVYVESPNNLSSFVSANGHSGNGFYGKFIVSAPGGENYPSFGLGVNISDEKQDMSAIKAISFWAKGSGSLKLAFPTTYAEALSKKVNGWSGEFAVEVKLTSDWTQYVIWADDIAPEVSSPLEKEQAEWSKHNNEVIKFSFRQGADIKPESNTTVEWYIDDLVFHKKK